MATIATKIFRPIAIGTVDQWALGAGATKFGAVDPGDPVSHDDDTSYIRENQDANQEQLLTIDPLFSERMAFVEEVRVHARVRDEGTTRASNRLRIYLGAVQSQGDAFNTAGTSYAAGGNNISSIIARPSGGDWVEGDFRDATFEYGIFTPSQSGPAIRCTSLWPAADYVPSTQAVQQHRQHASRRLMRRSRDEPIYTLTVPLEFLALELMDLINVSHDALPLSASRLEGLITHGLADRWRRGVMRLIGIDEDVSRRELTLHFKNHESYMTSFYSSEVLPAGGNDDLDDLMRIYPGGALTVDRNSRTFLEQPSTLVEEVSQAPNGTFFFGTGIFEEPMNHKGYLSEDSTDNPVLNSIAKNGETSWTSVENGGSLDLSTLRLAFDKRFTTNSWRFARSDDANDTYREQVFAVLSADEFRRVSITHSEQDQFTLLSWALQRSTDSNWWNDASEAWQVSKNWNLLLNNYSTSAARAVIARDFSNPIDIGANENWTLQIGLEGANLPAGGGEGNVYEVGALKGKLRFSPVVTEDEAVTTAANTVKIVKTSGSQLVPGDRGSLTLELDAIQDADDLDDGDQLALLYWQNGVSGGNYDVLLYEKPVGGNARFSFERFRESGGVPVFNARATYEVDIVSGQTYKISCVWTAETGNDLGIPNSTLRILVNNPGDGIPTAVQGTDGIASENHVAAVTWTELWKGCAPAATGYRRAMNYLRLIHFFPRPITNEEAA